MKTAISAYYLKRVNELALRFAADRSMSFPPQSRTKVFNSSYQVFQDISIYFYIKLNKMSVNRTSFKCNHIFCSELKSMSCKLYYKVIQILSDNKIIKVNNHYFHSRRKGQQDDQDGQKAKKLSFSKSYLIHRDVMNEMAELKRRFAYQVEMVEVSDKVIRSLGVDSFRNEDDSPSMQRKLNASAGGVMFLDECPSVRHYYGQLQYDEKRLDKFCGDDELMYNFYKRRLRKLDQKPKLVKGRLYHPFHEFSKRFRERVLRLDGERIKEVFDIAASDLHMLAKHLEQYDDIPIKEIMDFQRDVKSDFRRKFGMKKNGKCTARVKTAFKVYLNMKSERYDHIKPLTLLSRIDEYFLEHYPNIREYIKSADNIWQVSMDEEFSVMSDKLVNELSERGIKALTCHDSIYVKRTDMMSVPDIRELFYKKLDFAYDRAMMLFEL